MPDVPVWTSSLEQMVNCVQSNDVYVSSTLAAIAASFFPVLAFARLFQALSSQYLCSFGHLKGIKDPYPPLFVRLRGVRGQSNLLFIPSHSLRLVVYCPAFSLWMRIFPGGGPVVQLTRVGPQGCLAGTCGTNSYTCSRFSEYVASDSGVDVT